MFIRCYSKLMAYASCDKPKSTCYDCENVWVCKKYEKFKYEEGAEKCKDFRKAKVVFC